MINITDSATKYFYNIIFKKKNNTKIRIFVKNHNKSNITYCIAYCSINTIKITDIKIKYKKIIIYIDEKIASLLKNSEINLVKNKFSSYLTLKLTINIISNNNILLFEKIKNFIDLEINPKLAFHNGYIKLINIDENMIITLKFGGGCNGCSMANYTLKEAIQKKILKKFPEIKDVYDFTQHKHGDHSYY